MKPFKDKNGIELKVGQLCVYTLNGIRIGRILALPQCIGPKRPRIFKYAGGREIKLENIKSSGGYYIIPPPVPKIKIQDSKTRRAVEREASKIVVIDQDELLTNFL